MRSKSEPFFALQNGRDNSSYCHLLPPSPVRQFLISPPASPPVGWEPREEGEPLINYDLITALTKLTPGCTHELHPPSEAQPGIVVHVCGDEDEEVKEQPPEQVSPGSAQNKMKIQQTKRPPVRSSSEGSEDSSDSLAVQIGLNVLMNHNLILSRTLYTILYKESIIIKVAQSQVKV